LLLVLQALTQQQMMRCHLCWMQKHLQQSRILHCCHACLRCQQHHAPQRWMLHLQLSVMQQPAWPAGSAPWPAADTAHVLGALLRPSLALAWLLYQHAA
jgi:hypothetical protein